MRIRFLLTLAALGAATATASAAVSVFQFDGDFAAASGPATMSLYNDSAFGAFETGTVGGQPTGAYRFDAATPAQGLRVEHNMPANGGGATLNQFTLGYDLMLTGGSPWSGLLQTNVNNANDGDLFRNPAGGIGISGDYTGAVLDDQWYRLFFVFDLADADGDGARLYKYIDGTLVGTQGLDGVDGRWALDPTLLLLTDEDNETSAGSISSFLIADAAFSAEEVAAFGGPTAGGLDASAIPEPGTLVLLGLGALAARRRRR